MRHAALTFSFALMLLVGLRAADARSPVRVYYDDDFILETEDKAFQLRIRGNVHFDARLYSGENRGAPHSFDIRRARIDLQGRLFRVFTFRLQPEFAGQPYIRNAWVDVRLWAWLHLRVGQMKVPFSTSWLTRDNNVNFVERGTSAPIYPFFDRGLTVWGELFRGSLVYNLGIYTGAGIDRDASSGDIDDKKDVAARLFLQPFRRVGVQALRGLFLVAQMTWGFMSVPTTRFETGGLQSANYETALWRWRTEQILGTDGRVTDRVTARVQDRLRLGVELHYLLGPVTLSGEYLEVRYRDIRLIHDYAVGSSSLSEERLHESGGTVRSLSLFTSVYLTGERKRLDNGGWRTARPLAAVGAGGAGAWEILLRYSRTWTDPALFTRVPVSGYVPTSPSLPVGYQGPTPGAGNSVTAAVLDGAHNVHEFTLGVSWTVNNMVRVQLNDVFLWAPPGDRDGDGKNDNLLVSGARSNQADPAKKNVKSRWENAVMMRLIFKI